jgi:SNF2 family DNA or RNA helicase
MEFDSIDGNSFSKPLSSLNNALMQLRKLCNHPYLVLEDIKSIPDTLYDKYLIISSGKLKVLDKMLEFLINNGSKVISKFITTKFHITLF